MLPSVKLTGWTSRWWRGRPQVFVSDREGASRRDWVGTSAGRPGSPSVAAEGSAAGRPASTGAPPTTAAPAGDVERHRAQVTDLDELHARADLDHLAGDLVPEHQALRRRRAAADHVLVAAADVGRDALQDRRVRQLATDVGRVHPRPVLELERRIVDVVDLYVARSLVRDRLVTGHDSSLRKRAPRRARSCSPSRRRG